MFKSKKYVVTIYILLFLALAIIEISYLKSKKSNEINNSLKVESIENNNSTNMNSTKKFQ